MQGNMSIPTFVLVITKNLATHPPGLSSPHGVLPFL